VLPGQEGQGNHDYFGQPLPFREFCEDDEPGRRQRSGGLASRNYAPPLVVAQSLPFESYWGMTLALGSYIGA
jgi:hypothetical protein